MPSGGEAAGRPVTCPFVQQRIPPAVAAGHPDTARVGAATLSAGGDAVDAVAAMILAGSVAESIFTGLGGGGFATVYRAADRSVHCLDFFVSVPGLDGSTADPAQQIEVSFGGVAVPYAAGGATVAVPGTPFGVAELHRRFGRLPWEQIVAPARILAEQGTLFPQAHALLLPDIAPAMLLGAGAEIYAPGARLLLGGDRLHHPGLAETLGAYAEHGPDWFRRGPFAQRLVAEVRAGGGNLSLADLEAYRVENLTPRHVPFGDDGAVVHVRGNDLDRYADTLAAVDTGAYRRGGTERVRSLVHALRAPARRAETTSLVAVDADGNACAATHSLGLASGVWVDGVHANSMLGEGELLRGELVPGTRMSSMMVPQVVTGQGRELVGAGGAAGGSRIRPALVQIVAAQLLAGASTAEAVAAPRLSATPDTVHLEPGFEPGTAAALRADGDLVVEWAQSAPYFGGVSWIGATGPAADPRRGGLALSL